MAPSDPLVTIAVPSLNQGEFLHAALQSIFDQGIPVEVFVADGGSTDNSLEIIRQWAPRLAGWKSGKDGGQSAAINDSIALGTAPFVAWLNSDDLILPGGLARLLRGFEVRPQASLVYGRAWNLEHTSGRRSPVWVEPFDVHRLAVRCLISQPATLMRRSAWEHVGGVDRALRMAMDYDLWWRFHRAGHEFGFVDAYVAVNRLHDKTKTRRLRALHYSEAMSVVKRHYGRLPLKWWLAQPYSVLAKTYFRSLP